MRKSENQMSACEVQGDRVWPAHFTMDQMRSQLRHENAGSPAPFQGAIWNGYMYVSGSIAMPAAPALTDRQIEWAKGHDWFRSIDASGQIVVESVFTVDGGPAQSELIVWTAGFRALRDWAGY